MAKVKFTKNELKAQRDALRRYTRYLPTLQLKKQQLQLEVRRSRERLQKLVAEQEQYAEQLNSWLTIVDDSAGDLLASVVQVERWDTGVRNIAGIDVPTFETLVFAPVEYDLFETPLWFDDLVEGVKKSTEYALRRVLLEEELALTEQELRVTSQRVNLFEKVKIPESTENIRKIQIYLGDQQTNAVGRAKLAKGKLQAKAAETPAEVASG